MNAETYEKLVETRDLVEQTYRTHFFEALADPQVSKYAVDMLLDEWRKIDGELSARIREAI